MNDRYPYNVFDWPHRPVAGGGRHAVDLTFRPGMGLAFGHESALVYQDVCGAWIYVYILYVQYM